MHASRPARVLIVDDDTTMLRLLRAFLGRMKVRDVEEATNGLDALQKLRASRFDLIISDWHMQPMDGLDLLRHVRADSVLANLPFIMVSAECAFDRVENVERAGVSGYIVKPFSAVTLAEQIRIVCR